MAGGGALIVALVRTVVSIVGRGLISAVLGPIPGDFELVEAGTAFAVLAFMWLCQYHRGHVTVALFLPRAGRRANALVDVLANLLMTAAAGVLTGRLFLGMLNNRSFGEPPFILPFPVWWSFAAPLLGPAVLTLAYPYTGLTLPPG